MEPIIALKMAHQVLVDKLVPKKCKKLRLKTIDIKWLDKNGLIKALDCFLGKSPEIEITICPVYGHRPPDFCTRRCTCPDKSIHLGTNVCEERCMIVGDYYVLVRDRG